MADEVNKFYNKITNNLENKEYHGENKYLMGKSGLILGFISMLCMELTNILIVSVH